MFDRDLPLKKEIARNIKSFMKENSWTQLKLSQKTGISKSTLSDYLNHRTLINPGNVEILAETFGVSKGDIDPSFKSELNHSFVNEGESIYSTDLLLPLYGNISCGNGELIYEPTTTEINTPKEWARGGEYFYLIAKGDSMVGARIHEDDLLLIRKQETVENGEIAAVVIDDQVVLKRAYRDNGHFTLVSENPSFPPRRFSPETDTNIRIVGKLKKAISEF